MHVPLACICAGDDAAAAVDAMADAVATDDLDRAIEAGLLRWNGCIACVVANGSSIADAERMRAARDARLSALAARERYRARQHRLQQRSAQREAKRGATDVTSPLLQSTLPSAAAAALARAKAKAAARTKQ